MSEPCQFGGKLLYSSTLFKKKLNKALLKKKIIYQQFSFYFHIPKIGKCINLIN